MAQLRGSDPWLSLWCSYLLCCFSQKQREKKKTKTLKQLIAVLPTFFLPFGRPAMAELCSGGQVLLNYQNQSTERGKIGVAFWCIRVVSKYQKWKSAHSEWTFSKIRSSVCVQLLQFQHKYSWTLWSLFLFHILQTWVNTGCPLWVVFSY